MKRPLRIGTLFLLGATVALATTVGIQHFSPPYAFIKSDHPVEILRARGGGRWLFYDFQGQPADIIADVRRELLPRGFVEDSSEQPWFRFTREADIVVVCRGDQMAINTDGPYGGPIHYSPSNTSTDTCVWVREPDASAFEFLAFRIKKALLEW